MGTATLNGRRALVTGGSRGIGAEIVRRLAADGAAVAFTYSNSAAHADKLVAEVTADGGKVVAIHADSGDAAQVEAAVDQAAAELGGLDVLVNNAAVAYLAPIEETTAEQFERSLAVNIGGVYWASRKAIEHFEDGARIINIGSVNADRVTEPNAVVYSLTKGAVSSFTRALARELGPRNITVNNVQPGPVNTDMNPDEGDFADSIKRSTSLGRYGQTSEIASVVSFLAGPESAYVTAANLNVDGGFTA